MSYNPCHVGPPALILWLREHRQDFLDQWAQRLSTLSASYQQRPREELIETVTDAYDANLDVLDSCSFLRIDRFINFITELRLGAGFPLCDVQRSFELFRSILVQRLIADHQYDLLAQSVEPVNACLAYTIHRFSDHFQRMHERTLRRYAENLEEEIRIRTTQLAESRRRYKTLVEEIIDGYFVVQDQRIIFANQAFCCMHGTTLDEVLGRPFLSFVSPECRNSMVEACLGVIEGRRAAGQVQYTRLGVPSDQAATEVKARAVDLGDGPVIIGICRDISQRVAMEAKIRENERLAYVGHLSASLSHEIRNPLSSIKMNLQILARKLNLNGYDLRRLEITVHEVSRLESILRQLLDVARPLTISRSPVDVAALARRCVELLEAKAQAKNIRIIERYTESLPMALLDEHKVEQALINLLLNAIEATPEGGRITVWTKIAARSDDCRLEMGVRDSGAGIDAAHMPHLFTPYYTNKTQGSGLGLSNVKRIVDAHSGVIDVRSRKGRGAVFVMRLPCHV